MDGSVERAELERPAGSVGDEGAIRILLVVDPRKSARAVLRPPAVICGVPSQVMVADSVGAARDQLTHGRFDLVLSWFRLTDGSVLDLLASSATAPTAALVPAEDEPSAARAVRAGAIAVVRVAAGEPSLRLPQSLLSRVRRRARTTRRASLMQQAVECINDGVYITDLGGKLQYVNQSLREAYGYGDADLLGRPVSTLWSDEGHHELAPHNASLHPDGERGECVHRHRDGTCFPVQLSRSLICDQEGRAEAVIGTVRDITDRKLASERLSQAALHDALTQLPNRVLFMDRLAHAVRRARRDSSGFGVVFLDLDRFKRVNDDLGHATGDQVLRVVARRVNAGLREGDTVARLGGDEFAMLLEELESVGEAQRIVERTMRALARPIFAAGGELNVEASLGIAFVSAALAVEASPEALLRDADIAMYRAKALQGTRAVVFEASMKGRVETTTDFGQEITAALAEQQLTLHYQPIYDLPQGVLCGFEALIRWRHPTRGMLYPADFLPAAADHGLSIPIGRWVFQQAMVQLGRWRQISRSPLTMTVNVDDALVQSNELVAMVNEALRAAGVPGNGLLLDISEGAMVLDSPRAAATLEQLHRASVRFAIDDFGASASSIERLHRLPIDTLKIDRSLIARVGLDVRELRVVRTIVALARQLELSVSAEGIETVEQLGLLRTVGCDRGQGHLFSLALEVPEATRLLDRGTPTWPRFIVQPT